MRTLKRIFFILLALFLIGSTAAYWYASRQGRDSVDWSRNPGVEFDAQGIPTITAPDWVKVLERQGFVVASDRLWQMDLMRRSAAGTLSEWFGEKGLSWDEKRRNEDWTGVAEKAVRDLPAEERRDCESFADGVNRFIQERTHYWGAEYVLLKESPEPWSCRDSILILMSMVEDLTASYEDEALASVWRRFLPPTWEQFLFSQDHPWNKPVFAHAGTPKDILPSQPLKSKPLSPEESQEPTFLNSFFAGSNAWVYRGPSGTLLANDPHLGYGVPQLWYPLRLQISSDEWVAGVSLPGLPGVVLGRNPKIAWGFTNAGEDVDDLLEEEISKDGRQYMAGRKGGKKDWRFIETRPYTIKVRGGTPHKGVARFTHRGPLSERANLPGRQYSRQWLAFQPGTLRLPIGSMMKARNWEDFNRAMDSFTAPAQAIVFAQADGAIGMRVSGRGVLRKRTGLVPQPATEGEWSGFEPVAQRPRIFFPAGKEPRYLSTANQRLWLRGWGEHWGSDMRQDRIQTLLESGSDFSVDDFQRMQLDTQSRYFQQVLAWIAHYASPTGEAQTRMVKRYGSWDGVAHTNEALFAQAYYAQGMIASLALNRVRAAFFPGAYKDLPYEWKLHNVWELAMISTEGTDPWKAFGLRNREVAQWILESIEKNAAKLQGYSQANQWKAQHPFVRGVPYIGRFFGVDGHPQVGFDGLVRVERPYAGASTRLIWDVTNPHGGVWGFPVGASGHFLSKHYTGFREAWYAGKYFPVFPN